MRKFKNYGAISIAKKNSTKLGVLTKDAVGIMEPPPPKPPSELKPVVLKENFSLSREKEMWKMGR